MQRNNFIDVARGVGIACVVFGHNWIVLHDKGMLFRIIFSFHMPLFFVLTGAFLKPAVAIRRFVENKADSLLKPYFVVSFALIAKEILFHSVGDRPGFLCESLAGVVYGVGSSLQWPPLWFLPHLFVTSIVSLAILRMIGGFAPRYILLCCGCLSVLGCSALQYLSGTGSHVWGWNRPGLPWSIDLLPITCSFIVLGYVARDRMKDFSAKGLLVGVAAVSFAVLHMVFSETIDLNFRIYGQWVVATAEALAGIYLCLSVAKVLAGSAILGLLFSYIGSRSLFLLIFHWQVQGMAFILLQRYAHALYFCASLSFMIAVIVPILIYEVAARVNILGMILLPTNRESTWGRHLRT